MVTFKRVLVASLALLPVCSVASATDVTGALVFVGITPCRIFDTRGAGFTGQAGTPSLVAGADRTFQITGIVPGVPAQCGIPSNAAAISVNFTATGFVGQGDIRVRPAGAALGLTSIINYQVENIANATTVPLGPSGGTDNGITVHCDAVATDFLADVNGYYVPRPVTIVLSDSPGSSTSTTPVIISSIYAANMRSQGHLQARIVARWNNSAQAPACVSGGTATMDLAVGGVVLTSVTQVCGNRAWLDYSAPFTIPAGAAFWDLRATVTAGTVSWRSVALELMK